MGRIGIHKMKPTLFRWKIIKVFVFVGRRQGSWEMRPPDSLTSSQADQTSYFKWDRKQRDVWSAYLKPILFTGTGAITLPKMMPP